MRTVLSSTALVLALSTPAFAQQDGMFMTAPEENVLRASELVGARLYVSESEVSQDQMGMNENWQDAGEISEIAMSQDGQVDFIVADIGGFLGMGEKSIAVSADQLNFVSDGQNADEWFVVLTAAQSDLENAPEFEGFDSMQAMNDAGGSMDQTTGQGTGEATASGERQTAENENNLTAQVDDSGNQTSGTDGSEEQMAQGNAQDSGATLAPQDGTQTEQADSGAQMQQDGVQTDTAMTEEGYTAIDTASLTAEDLTGQRVYDGSGEFVGDVGELVLGSDGTTIEQAVIDVGGFLGIGEKPVAISIDELNIQREEDGGALRITVPMTQEELESQPRYEG